MKIGVPKEIKQDEYRVAMTPAGVRALCASGHEVYIERTAGDGSFIPAGKYEENGAVIVETIEEVFEKADMVVKVKEPLEKEYELMRDGQIMFTYLHLAADETLTRKLVEKKVTAIGYETIQLSDGSLPLLMPMSEVAGRMSVQLGAQYLEKRHGGRGVLLSGPPGVPPAEIVIIGGGMVGLSAAKVAVGLGASVTILDISVPKLRYMDEILMGRVVTVMSNLDNIERSAKYADLLIGAVLIAGAKAPKLVSREIVEQMKPGSVIVDVAIDQGGCVETSRPTTHTEPTFTHAGVVHYCVGNMPAAVPRTSTLALTNETSAYAQALADKGFEKAVADDPALKRGVNVHDGRVVHPGVAGAFGMECHEI